MKTDELPSDIDVKKDEKSSIDELSKQNLPPTTVATITAVPVIESEQSAADIVPNKTAELEKLEKEKIVEENNEESANKEKDSNTLTAVEVAPTYQSEANDIETEPIKTELAPTPAEAVTTEKVSNQPPIQPAVQTSPQQPQQIQSPTSGPLSPGNTAVPAAMPQGPIQASVIPSVTALHSTAPQPHSTAPAQIPPNGQPTIQSQAPVQQPATLHMPEHVPPQHPSSPSAPPPHAGNNF